MVSNPRVRKRVVTTHRVIPTWVLWVILVAVIGATLITAGYTIWRPYSGFGGKTAWHWLQLAGISAAIALVGWIFTRKQNERAETIALEEAQNATLLAYLDQMSNLMVNHKLGNTRSKIFKGEPETKGNQDGKHEDSMKESLHKRLAKVWTTKAKVFLGVAEEEPEDSICEVAQARTSAVLLALDARHKRRPLKLIYELGLINKRDNIIDLKNAGLDHADFSELSLREAHLMGVDLRVSDLNGADLSDSDLTEADLRGADLRRADLSETVLTKANLLPYDERDPERLSPHRLTRTDLTKETLSPRKLTLRDSRIIITKGREHWWPTVTELTVTNLRHAVLFHANLCGANLGGADLFHADLRETSLTEADLLRATLKKADLREASLTGANLKEADLSKANLGGVDLSGANMNGTIFREADLGCANLRGANLNGADLSRACLSNANLSNANLHRAKGITNEDLKLWTHTIEGATMPNGQKHEDWLRDKEDRGKGEENGDPP